MAGDAEHATEAVLGEYSDLELHFCADFSAPPLVPERMCLHCRPNLWFVSTG